MSQFRILQYDELLDIRLDLTIHDNRGDGGSIVSVRPKGANTYYDGYRGLESSPEHEVRRYSSKVCGLLR